MGWFSKKEDTSYHCESGDHDVDDGSMYASCAVCGKKFCHEHQGNPDTMAGNLVGCDEHGEEVEEHNRKRWGWI